MACVLQDLPFKSARHGPRHNGSHTGNCDQAHNTDVGREQVCTDSDLGPDGKGEA